MRINPDFTPDILSSLWQAQERERRALMEVSTGRRVNAPSDDPAASAALVHNQAQLSQTDQYMASTTAVEGMLKTADSTLASVITSLNKTISLGVQGATGTISLENQQQIAQEVRGLRDQVIQLANVSYQGVYLFGGTVNGTAPFSMNAAQTAVQYNGNQGVNTVEIAEGRSIQVNLPGSALFQGAGGDVMGSLQQLSDALDSGNSAAISAATTQLRGAFDFLSQQRVFYGNAISQLDSNTTFLQSGKLNLQSQQNDLVGVDLSQAALDAANAQTAHDSALAAAARAIPQTLLDYLK